MSLSTNSRMRIVRSVALEADAFYDDAKKLGELAARSLGQNKRSQATGLESIANSSQKVSDVFDYVKLRTARQKEWQKDNLGKELITNLEKLALKRDRICADLHIEGQTFEGRTIHQEVYILLIRAFVSQFAAQYEYAVSISEKQP